MNITFLIGNGFDVGMGLKSKFSDFFPRYIEQSKNKPEHIRALSENIDENIELWSDFEKQLGEYTAKFKEENKKEFKDQLRDFELCFIEYLEEEESRLSYEDQEEISNKMKDGLQSFWSSLNLPTMSSAQIKGVLDSNETRTRIYNFICFNYTDVLEHCLDTLKNDTVGTRKTASGGVSDRIGKVVHPHGTCLFNPIMGVNDVTQIKNKELAKDQRFYKYLVKPELNKVRRMGYDQQGNQLVENSDIICVYGMSIGATDKIWWQRILNWLSMSTARQLVLFVYDSQFQSSSQFDWPEKEDEIIDHLTNLVESSSSHYVEAMRNRIHIAIHRNIFAMNLRKNNDGFDEKQTEKELATV